MTKFCKDCEHAGYNLCGRPILLDKVNLVTGETHSPLGEWCHIERKKHWFRDSCGPDGKYFKAKAD